MQEVYNEMEQSPVPTSYRKLILTHFGFSSGDCFLKSK